MKTGRILIVEDDLDISNLLRIFFDGEGNDLDELQQLLTSLDGGAFKIDDESGNASPELSLSIGVLRADEQNLENIFQVTKSSANARQLDG